MSQPDYGDMCRCEGCEEWGTEGHRCVVCEFWTHDYCEPVTFDADGNAVHVECLGRPAADSGSQSAPQRAAKGR